MHYLLKTLAIVFLFLLIFVTSCQRGGSPKSFLVDNPTDEAIAVMFDNEVYEIPAQGGIYVDLPNGQHTMEYNGDRVKFMVISCDQDMVINPTLSNYVLSYQVYYDVNKGFDDEGITEITESYLFPFVTSSGDTINVPFKVINPLFIERYEYYWNFGLTDAHRAVQKIRVDKSFKNTNLIQSNLYREKDFRIREEIPADFDLPKTYTSYNDFGVVNSDSLFGGLVSDCEGLNKVIAVRKAKFDSLLVCEPADSRRLLYGIQGASTFGGEITVDLDKECSSRYDRSRQTNYDSISLELSKRYKRLISARNVFLIE